MTTPPDSLAGMSMAELLDNYRDAIVLHEACDERFERTILKWAEQTRAIRAEIDARLHEVINGLEYAIESASTDSRAKAFKAVLARLKGKTT